MIYLYLLVGVGLFFVVLGESIIQMALRLTMLVGNRLGLDYLFMPILKLYPLFLAWIGVYLLYRVLQLLTARFSLRTASFFAMLYYFFAASMAFISLVKYYSIPFISEVLLDYDINVWRAIVLGLLTVLSHVLLFYQVAGFGAAVLAIFNPSRFYRFVDNAYEQGRERTLNETTA
ncbi:hypothetical protein LRP49_23350 [Enterovibrio sp. ZSDZ35]|uniref:Uncharacterized protein n=1 Tax=Enterovibrio qingdaonensis TaxID=2899818 RepID=A0ABT5QT16_9GAMM|nr:hypothetical protein [Enterovibrio sp. ZSDZ35]MDD1784115.1 hypothetical protein [Enterovibrio sp. ZSDZ35]